ncbi:unnamed protein product [Rhizopus stolonifer]
MYWEKNADEINLRRHLRTQNHSTIECLNQIANDQIVRLAEQSQDLGEFEESRADNITVSDNESCADSILQQTAILASDDTSVNILKTQMNNDPQKSL